MFNEIADLQFHLDPCIGEFFGLFSRFSLDDEDGPLPNMQAQYVHLLPPPNSCKRVSNLSEPVRCDECGEDIPRWSDYFYRVYPFTSIVTELKTLSDFLTLKP